MWILSKWGDLYDIGGKSVEVDNCHDNVFAVKMSADNIKGSDDYQYMMRGTEQECKDELRKIALALVYGAVVYEIGKGIVDYKLFNQMQSAITSDGHCKVMLENKKDEDPEATL
jgi:hypothetical protein